MTFSEFVLVMNVFDIVGTCDLVVRTHDYKGRILDTNVQVVTSSGRVIAPGMEKSGEAHFCDIGVGPVTVIVEPGKCGEVTVKGISARWGETVTLPVFYQNCHGFMAYSSCGFILRFQNTLGVPLSGKKVWVGSESGRPELTDQWGRLRQLMSRGIVSRIRYRMEGYRPVELDLKCDPKAYPEERVLVLTPE